MDFIRSKNVSEGQAKLISQLTKYLSQGPVFWLLTGGQNIPVEIATMYFLDDSLTKNLFMLLGDERYGPRAHKDSNYMSLIYSGLHVRDATFPDILEGSPTPEIALERYKQYYEQFKNQAKVTIGQFGIGDDGHIAGVLPHTVGVSSDDSVVYYESTPYKRLTLTLNALRSIDESYIFCFGKQKKEPLTRLQADNESLADLPALILKDMKNVTVYNDQI